MEQPKKRRDSNPLFEELEQILGTSFSLYDSILHFCRTLFIKTTNIKFCTFRYEILMYLHDNKVNKLFDADPMHQICILFENWIKNGDSDHSKVKMLYNILKTNDIPLYGELAMICGSPMVSYVLQKSFVTFLEQKVAESPLFDEPCLVLLCQLLSATQDIPQQLSSTSQLPELDDDVKKFVVLIVEMMKPNVMEFRASEMVELFTKCFVARKILLLILPKWLNKKDERKFIAIWRELKEQETLLVQEELFMVSMSTFDPISPWYPLFGPDIKKMKKK